MQRYKAGLGNYLNVLTAETPVLAQRRLAVDLTARVLDTQVALIRALGGGYAPEPVSQTQNTTKLIILKRVRYCIHYRTVPLPQTTFRLLHAQVFLLLFRCSSASQWAQITANITRHLTIFLKLQTKKHHH